MRTCPVERNNSAKPITSANNASCTGELDIRTKLMVNFARLVVNFGSTRARLMELYWCSSADGRLAKMAQAGPRHALNAKTGRRELHDVAISISAVRDALQAARWSNSFIVGQECRSAQ